MRAELLTNLGFLVVTLDEQCHFDLWKQATESCLLGLAAACGGRLGILWSPVPLAAGWSDLYFKGTR